MKRSRSLQNELEQLEATDPVVRTAAKKYDDAMRALLEGKTKTVEIDKKVLRWLLDVAVHAAAFRTETCKVVPALLRTQKLEKKLEQDMEIAYDRAASRLDGALNELRLAREEAGK